MNTRLRYLLFVLPLICSLSIRSFGDTIEMTRNFSLQGNVIQTNGEDVLILTRNSAYNFSKAGIVGIKKDAEEALSTNRLSGFRKALIGLGKMPWASNITAIPATVVDKGILRNVPYTSFRCADDYEVNIYGDPENPACIEIGIYRSLLESATAKNNCIQYISSLLNRPSDQEFLLGLDLNKDSQTKDDLTFEITPPTSEDAYNGWWVSVYSEKQLDASRASDEEMKQITMSKNPASKDAANSSWSERELKLARPTPTPQTVSFITPSGTVVTNAVIVRNDGVSITYRTGPTSGGTIKLSDLPEDLRKELGYDEQKAQQAEANEQARKQRDAIVASQPVAIERPYTAQAPTYGGTPNTFGGGGGPYAGGDDGYSGGGGRVYVRGYTRKDGTYVQPHTRSAPRKN